MIVNALDGSTEIVEHEELSSVSDQRRSAPQTPQASVPEPLRKGEEKQGRDQDVIVAHEEQQEGSEPLETTSLKGWDRCFDRFASILAPKPAASVPDDFPLVSDSLKRIQAALVEENARDQAGTLGVRINGTFLDFASAIVSVADSALISISRPDSGLSLADPLCEPLRIVLSSLRVLRNFCAARPRNQGLTISALPSLLCNIFKPLIHLDPRSISPTEIGSFPL